MSWAARRRFVILLIVVGVFVAFMATLGIATLYKTPTCTDEVQNQGEAGVDCGGPCQYLCVDQKIAPVILLERALVQEPGRVDFIAYVENKNLDAAVRDVSYTIKLYAADKTLLKMSTGSVDLPAGARVPIYVPALFASGNVKGVQGFLEIGADSLTWFTASPPPALKVSDIRIEGTTLAPRITAVLSNVETSTVNNVKVVVVVYDSSKNVVAASRTLIPTISGLGSATATFTWFQAFSKTPALIDVTPVQTLAP